MNTHKNISIGLIIGLSTIFASEAKIAAKTANLTDKGLKAFLDDWAKTNQSILPK